MKNIEQIQDLRNTVEQFVAITLAKLSSHMLVNAVINFVLS